RLGSRLVPRFRLGGFRVPNQYPAAPRKSLTGDRGCLAKNARRGDRTGEVPVTPDVAVWRQVEVQRDRFMRDPVPVRLGNLASTLARISSCAAHPERRDLVYRLLSEAEFFIDCTGPDTDVNVQPDL